MEREVSYMFSSMDVEQYLDDGFEIDMKETGF